MKIVNKLIAFLVISLVLVGCLKRQLKLEVINDLIILQQSNDDFDLAMIYDNFEFSFGENKEDLSQLDYIGEVLLADIGNYEIEVYASKKNQYVSQNVIVNVVDQKDPTFKIFEKELLVVIDETFDLKNNNYFVYLDDGINGNISERIEIDGEYDLETVGSYPIKLNGSDLSGNSVGQNINIRVTDLIDEKAFYLYNKALLVMLGDNLIYLDEDSNNEIINLDQMLEIFTPTFKSHFFWLSGIEGPYNKQLSKVHLERENGKYYLIEKYDNVTTDYKNTSLKLQYEDENYRHYIAKTTFEDDSEKLAKFVIRKINNVWLVDEFYLQYD